MGVNLDKMKQDRARRQGGGELWTAPEGDTAVYVCPPFREEDDVPYWEIRVHYGLGSKGKAMAVCLEPADNPILTNPLLAEQLGELGKDIAGGCPVCEAIDRGEKVSNDDSNGKSMSRWLWDVMPVRTRSDARENFKPWPQPDQIVPFMVSYRVWNGIGDMFGSAGDITDPDAAILVRLIRTGKGITTKWEVQGDVDTIRKPLALSDGTKQAIEDACKPGGKCDPYRVIASMVRTRKEVENILSGTVPADDEYEEGDEDSDDTASDSKEDGSKFQPPGKGDKKAAKGGKKAPAKGKGKNSAKSKGNGESELAKLAAERGAAPPCFRMDPDPEEEGCQKCAWKVECADHCGVPVPPDPGQDTASDDGPSGEGIPVEECEAGLQYEVDGSIVTYTGPARGKHYFKDSDGKPVKVDAGTVVMPTAPPDEGEAEEDEGLAALEAELAARKAKAAKGKKK